MKRQLKQEVHEYCKNREERKKRYDNKRKHVKNYDQDNYDGLKNTIKRRDYYVY